MGYLQSNNIVIIGSIVKPVRFATYYYSLLLPYTNTNLSESHSLYCAPYSFVLPFSRVWRCNHTPINQMQTAMEQLDPSKSKSSQVVLPHPHILRSKTSSIRMAGHSELQVFFLHFVMFLLLSFWVFFPFISLCLRFFLFTF